jgi:glycosyltransferase involved in cell wall biosynthesis
MENITVVVPFYNRAGFFKRLLKSIEDQSLEVSRLLIVDNGSCIEQIENIWGVISNSVLNVVLISSLNRGNANFARNLGYELASDGYVAYIDSDDWWDKDHLLESISVLNKSKCTGVYSGACIYGNGININKSIDVNLLGNPFFLLFSKKGYIAQTSSYVLRKNKCCNFVQWDESLKRHQDFDFFLNHYYFGGGWCFSAAVTSNIDWEEGGTKNTDVKSKLLFYKKWEKEFPKSICKHYLYTQISFCTKISSAQFKKEFKTLYLVKFNSLLDKLITCDALINIRVLCVLVLEKSHLKFKLRKFIRKIFN